MLLRRPLLPLLVAAVVAAGASAALADTPKGAGAGQPTRPSFALSPHTITAAPALPAAPHLSRTTTPSAQRTPALGGYGKGGDGLRGVSSGPGYAGVAGLADNADGIGVYGENLVTGSVGQLGMGGAGATGLMSSGTGVYGDVQNAGTGVLGQADSLGAGVLGRARTDSAAGVVAEGGSATGTALRVDRGAIRVSGAGVGTPTAVFVVVPTTSNTTVWTDQGSYGKMCSPTTTIDHPQANGDPNAILFLTPVGMFGMGNGGQGAFSLNYDPVKGRWVVNYPTVTNTTLFGGGGGFDTMCYYGNLSFNLMVVKT